MAEVFGLAATITTVLEQALKLFIRVRSARSVYKDLPILAERHLEVVESTHAAVMLVRDEKALRTANVGEVLRRIEATSAALTTHLDGLARHVEKGAALGFARQLFSNSEEARRLETIMARLGRDKTDLVTSLSVVNDGLTKTVGGAVEVNTAAVRRIRALLRPLLGEAGGLNPADFVTTKQGEGSGNDMEVARLGSDDLIAVANLGRKVRIVQRNEALQDALQVNTPIGVDIWKDIDFLKIEDNKAHENAAQFNYPMDKDTFLAALGHKYRQPASGRAGR